MINYLAMQRHILQTLVYPLLFSRADMLFGSERAQTQAHTHTIGLVYRNFYYFENETMKE